MPTWASYSLSDLLMFAPDSYFRLFEIANTQLWPLQLAVLPIAAFTLLPSRQVSGRRVQAFLLAAAWALVAWWFFAAHFAQINLAAPWFAAAFAAQALLLLATAPIGPPKPGTIGKGRSWPGQLLILYALFLHPMVGLLAGRDWRGVELFGVAPDPTALATLGVLLRGRWPLGRLLLVVPLLWCLASGLTYVAMGVPHGLATPAAALAALAAQVWLRHWLVTAVLDRRPPRGP
jgi:hypothetical protein